MRLLRFLALAVLVGVIGGRLASAQSAAAGAAPAAQTTVGDAAEQKIDEVGGEVTPPKALYTPEAAWPKDANGKREAPQGMRAGLFHRGKPLDVVLSIVIGSDGLVTDAHVLKSMYSDFEENALAAVKTWRFKPSMKDGKPVSVKVTAVVTFKLYF